MKKFIIFLALLGVPGWFMLAPTASAASTSGAQSAKKASASVKKQVSRPATRVKHKAAVKKTKYKKAAVKTKKTRKHRTSRRTHRARLPNYGITADGRLLLGSGMAFVIHQETGQTLYAKNADTPNAIASLTKLMTAMVVIDAALPLDEELTISVEDVDTLRHTTSRLGVGTTLTRREIMLLALMSSENRAAAALARTYPGGVQACLVAMNQKAQAMGLHRTRFADSTGLHSKNISTASELARLVEAAHKYPLIREMSTHTSYDLLLKGKRHTRSHAFINTNALVRAGEWDIGLSKTGYIREAGRCLVMQTRINEQPIIIVLLDAAGKYTRIGDAVRIKQWLERGDRPQIIAQPEEASRTAMGRL